MSKARASDGRPGTSRFDASRVEDGTGTINCCATSIGTWNGNKGHGTWDNATNHGTWNNVTNHSTWNDSTSNGIWSANTAGYDESTDFSLLKENASLSLNGSQTTWGSNAHYSAWEIVVLSTLAGLISVVTVGGNLTVLLSFFIERTIRQPTNYFIASLACSDLLIGLISMPLYTVYLLTGANWPLGEVICDLWLSVDYTACLCSIYTVFCITIDRFCSVSIPTRYRNWRTASKVRMLVAATWLLPIVVFFTTIFGWQFFVGERSVPEGKCYVQYMENAVFNCALQVGYFWTTLVVMCTLYAGIYRVALTLQRKSEAKMTKMASALNVDPTRDENVRRATIADEHGHPLPRDTTDPPPDGRGSTVVKIIPGWATPPRTLPVLSADGDPGVMVNGDCYSSSPGFLSDTEPSSPPLLVAAHRRHTMVFCSPGPRSNDRRVIRTSEVDVGCSRLLRPPPREMMLPRRKPHREYQSQQLELSVTEANRRASSGGVRCQKDTRFVQHPEDGKEHLRIRFSEEELLASSQPNGHSELMDGAGEDLEAEIVEHAARLQQPDEVSMMPESKTFVSLQLSPVWKRRNGTFHDLQCCSVDRDISQMTGNDDEDVNRSRSAFTYSTTVDSFNDTVSGQTWFNYNRQSVDPCEGYNRNCYSIDYSTSFTLDESASPFTDSIIWPLAEESQVPSFNRQSVETTTSINRNSRHWGNRPSSGRLNSTKSVRRSTNTRPATRSSIPGKGGRKTVNRAKKALRTITVILGAFVFCWTPWHILSLIVGFCPDYAAALQALYDISYWLCYLNSPVNPFCYAFANHQLKKTFLRILKLDWHRT